MVSSLNSKTLARQKFPFVTYDQFSIGVSFKRSFHIYEFYYFVVVSVVSKVILDHVENGIHQHSQNWNAC